MTTTRRTFLTALCTLPGLRWLRPAPLPTSGIAIARAARGTGSLFNPMADVAAQWAAAQRGLETIKLRPPLKIGDTIQVKRPARFSASGEDMWPDRLQPIQAITPDVS